MPAHRSVERFESSHRDSGQLDTPGFARQAALIVAVMAALLAPADHALVEEMHHDQEHVDHYNDKHLLDELAEVGREVAIVLATVSIIAHRRWLLGAGVAVGTVLLVAGALVV
jgi:hypothetical protein